MSSDSKKPASPGIELVRDADLLIESFIPMPTAQDLAAPPPYNTIPLPFCTPQITDSFDSPFARGYNAELANTVGISQEQLLAFIDGLNLAMTASPVVNFAGQVLGMVPFHWAMIAGIVMQTAAQTGMHILSKTLTDRYLRAANLRLFKPRGLSVRICSTAAMQHLVMLAGNGKGLSTMDKIGRGVGTLLIRAPLPFSSRIVRAIADKPPKVNARINAVGDGKKLPLSTQRRLASLEGHALPLDLDMPPPAKPKGVMDTMGSWAVKYDSYRVGRKGNKTEARRMELERIESMLQMQRTGYPSPLMGAYSGQIQGPSRSYGYGAPEQMGGSSTQPNLMGWSDPRAARRERRNLRKAERRARKRERGRNGLLSGLIGPKETVLERRVANADLLESWTTDRVLWVVIMSAEFDKEIDGIEQAEAEENEEQVDAKTWTAEIIRERDELEEEEDNESDSDEQADKQYGRSKEAPH